MIALYRKYRPQTFAQVRGQEDIVSALTASLAKKKTSHAYLFAGSRGTGKTSIARILARELGAHEEDIYEIDAASNRGIDDIRDLKESVSTKPFSSPVKVYIVDEVHMLTKEAFNALLKTLEEPPEHVVFILATTELAKVPETIISRAEVYRFKRPTLEILTKALEEAAKAEGYALEAQSAGLLARLADGAFRDAYGLLQKVLSGVSGKKVSRTDIERIVGVSDRVVAHSFARALCEKKPEDALRALSSLRANNTHAKNFGEDVLEYIRAVLLIRFSTQAQETARESFGDDIVGDMLVFAKSATHINSSTLVSLIDALTLVRTAPDQVLPFEIALLKILESGK